MKGRIKIGAPVFQDHAFGRWPSCKAPGGGHEAADPSMLFDVEWHSKGGYWVCIADGFGRLDSPGLYGNGSIFVTGHDQVEIAERAA